MPLGVTLSGRQGPWTGFHRAGISPDGLATTRLPPRVQSSLSYQGTALPATLRPGGLSPHQGEALEVPAQAVAPVQEPQLLPPTLFSLSGAAGLDPKRWGWTGKLVPT